MVWSREEEEEGAVDSACAGALAPAFAVVESDVAACSDATVASGSEVRVAANRGSCELPLNCLDGPASEAAEEVDCGRGEEGNGAALGIAGEEAGLSCIADEGAKTGCLPLGDRSTLPSPALRPKSMLGVATLPVLSVLLLDMLV